MTEMLMNGLVSHSASDKHRSPLLDKADTAMASLTRGLNSESDEISMSHLLDHS